MFLINPEPHSVGHSNSKSNVAPKLRTSPLLYNFLEMEEVTRQLDSQARVPQLTGIVERLRTIVDNLQEICEQLDGLEFVTDVECKSKEERDSSSIDGLRCQLSFQSGTTNSLGSSSLVELEHHNADPGSDKVTTESNIDRRNNEAGTESCEKGRALTLEIFNESESSFSMKTGLPDYCHSNLVSPILPTQDNFVKPRSSTPLKESVNSSLAITKTPDIRKKVTKRARVDTPRYLSHNNSKGTVGNIRRQEEKLPGRKYGRRRNDYEETISWLPVASLNAQDIPIGSKIKFQYEFGGQLKPFKGRVADVGQLMMRVLHLKSPQEQGNLARDHFWKTFMKDVMIQSTAQASKI
ncbi:unnamed protein product [Allacma fusca]|uniref:Uncharacterized protein n=1 Tax=Allacma fusca TaxID=39272 RepID=A0A8J2L276_9HEXA|nr:unnamed protein product [Allacma fusca]